MPIQLRLKIHAGGKTSSPSVFAFTIGKITDLKLGLLGYTTSSAHLELGWVDESKHPPRCVAKLQLHDSKASRKLKFGATASKRGPSATLMIVLRGYAS